MQIDIVLGKIAIVKESWLNALIRLEDWHESNSVSGTLNIHVFKQFYQRNIINYH